MKKRIIAMVLSVAMMLTMFPTGVLADDFVYEENAAGITENVEGQSNENQGEGESASIVNEEPAPAETEDQTTDPAASESQETAPVESESQATDPAASASQATEPAASASQATEPVESESQATDPAASSSQATEPAASESQATDSAASASQAAEPVEKDNSVNTADLYDPQPTDITAKQTTINVGQPLDLTGRDVSGYGGTPVHQWSTEDETVATVTGNGSKATVTGVGVGKTKISHYCYRDYDYFHGFENTETIEIEVVAKVTDAAIQVEDDASATPVTFSKYAAPPVLEAAITPTDAEYKSCTWSVDNVDNKDVLEVNPTTGAITAKSVGEATVTLTVTNYDNSEVKATLPVTVTNPIPTSAVITVTEGKADDLYPQDTLTLVPGVEPGSADEYNYAWESGDAEVATVAGDATKATVTALKAGTARITFTVTPKSAEAAASADEASPAANVATATIDITVKAVIPAQSVAISSDKTEVPVRGTVQFTAAVNPADAQGSYEWNTDDEQVLTIDETTGLATGKAEGKANVTMTFNGKDGKKTTSNSIEITVTPAAQQDKREALVYYLLDPNKDANSNDSGQWGPNSLGTATVDVAGATWHDAVVNGKTEKDKNCFDNLDTRVVSWPDTCPGGVVTKKTDPNSVWMSIFNKWKTTANSIPGTAVTPDDVVEIKLVPAKISKDNGTTPDMHLDCNVVVRCKNRVTVSFQLKDVDDKLVKAQDDKVYYVNSQMPVTAVPSVAPTKLDKEGKEYAFRGWYRNKDFSEPITFNGPYQLGTDNVTFYGRYVEKHQVTYDLDGGSWAGDNTLVYDVYEGDTYTVKAAPKKEGFEFTGWKLDESTTYQAGNEFTMPDSDVTLVAQWKATTRSYTVNYYWNGTTTPVHDSTTGTANVGEKIENLTPVSVEGYTPVSTESKSIIIDEDATKNVVTFFYYKDVTLTANSATETYDGTAKSVSGFTGAPEGADFSAITVGATGTDAGTYHANFPEGTVGTVDATGKYIVTAATDGKLTITKRTVTLKSADLDKKYDGNALENGNAPLAVEDGFVDGEGATYAFTGSQTLVGSSDNEFTYTLNEGTDAGNYTINTQFGKLKVTDREEGDKLKITVEANSGSKTYDGKPLTVDGFKTQSFEVEGNTYTVEGLTASATGTNVSDSKDVVVEGTAVVKDAAGNDVTAQFKVETKNGTLTITKRTVTLKSADLSKEYDGTALVNGETALETETGWAEGEGATYTFTGSQTVVGSSANEFSYALNDGTNADNYEITKTEGTLTVTNRAEKYEITITAKSGTKTYNGKEQEVTGFVTDKFTVNGQEYTVSGLSAEGKGTDAGEYTAEVTGTAMVTDATGNDVTAQFTVKTENGKLTIAKRTVTLKSADLSKEYDGTALVNGETALETETGWAEGEGATYTFTGSQTVVGSSANEFSYALNDGTNADNYEITKTEGTLTVTNRAEKYEITITAKSGTKTYNGKEQEVTGFVTDKFTVNGQEYTVSGLSAEGKGTDAGEYTAEVTGTAMVTDATGNDVTAQFTVKTENGSLKINPYMILIEPTETTFKYNGEEPKVKTDKIKISNENGEGLLLDHYVESIETVGSGVDAGTYEWFSGHDAKILDGNGFNVTANYQISYAAQTMTITPAPLTVTTEGGSKVYDGKPLTNEDGNITGLVNGETAKVKTTGSQTNVGTSDNTYVIEWGTAKVGNYKVTQEILGKLEVTAQSINPTPDPEKPDEKDPAYGGVQIDSPSDSVYDGTEHKWVPTVLDKDGNALTGADYKVTYSTDNFTDVTGTITVTITGEGNYTGTVTRTYQITPAPLKITTNSAEKTYDGSALTADGKIEGLVKGETVTFTVTGSQTEVGESKNTYTIKWDGSAKETNYTIAEDAVTLGTLKVNARSGGGSSSNPTPEDEPTPTPTPTPLPTLPTTPAPTTPTRRVTRSTATVTEPASRPTEQITENETPKAESEPEVIEDEETPLAPMAGGAWALVNLILMLLTVLASLLLLLGYLGKKKYAKEDEYGNALHDANGNEIIDYTRNKKGFWRVASLIPAIAAVIAFALTENMRLPMVMTDRWTLLMVIIAVVQLIVAVLCKKKKESEEDENQANA